MIGVTKQRSGRSCKTLDPPGVGHIGSVDYLAGTARRGFRQTGSPMG